MPKPSAPGAIFKLISCWTLLIFAAPYRTAGQSAELQKRPTENVRRQFQFSTGGPSGLSVEQRGRRTGIFPSFCKGADSLVAPRLRLHFPVEQRTQPLIRASKSPLVPNFAQLAASAVLPALNTSNPFGIHPFQTAEAFIPPMPNAVASVPQRQNLCSVPLLRVPRDPSTNFSIRQVPVPRMDSAMVVRPSAPACHESNSSGAK